MFKIAMASAALVLLTLPAQADYRRFCTPAGQCFVCARGQPTCEVSYALSRAMTPPTSANMGQHVAAVAGTQPRAAVSRARLWTTASTSVTAGYALAGAVEAGDHR